MNKQTIKNQLGFSIVEILAVLIIIGAVVFAGIFVYNRNKDEANETTNSVPETSQQEINNSEDLQPAEDDLNNIDVEDLDTTELDAAEADLL